MSETLSEKIAEIVKPTIQSAEIQDTDSSPKEVIRELKEVLYVNKDIYDFEEFLTEGIANTEVDLVFSIDTKYLRYACGVLKHVYTGSKIAPNTIKITVFENQLKLSGFNPVIFGEVFIPLFKNTNIRREYEKVSFVFDFPTLARLTSSFEKAILTCAYKSDKKLLEVKSGNAVLELATKEETDFIQFHNKFKDIQEVKCTPNIETLQSALGYLSLFIKKELQQNTALIDSRDSTLICGNTVAIGIMQSDSFNNMPLKLKHEVVPSLSKILPYFYSPKVKLFETNGYYILRDQNLYLGIEKTDASFPSLKHLFATKVEESFTLRRDMLLSSLQKLSVVDMNNEALLQFNISGRPPKASLRITIKDVTGKQSKDDIQVLRTSNTFEDTTYFIYPEFLIKTLSFIRSPEVTIQMLKDRAILIKDITPTYSTTTILGITKESEGK